MDEFLKGLVVNGLKDLASATFSSIASKGIDKTKEVIKETTGLDIDFNRPPTQEEIKKLEEKEPEVVMSLEEIKEYNRHDEALKQLELELMKEEEESREHARSAIINSLESESKVAHLFGYLAIFMIPTVFLILAYFFHMLITDNSIPENVRLQVLPYIENGIWVIIGFFVGSSTGSKLKGK